MNKKLKGFSKKLLRVVVAIFCICIGAGAQAWESLGNAGFTDSVAGDPSIAINGSGIVYVAFADAAQDHKATVMYFNGSSWATLGNPGFSAGEAGNTNITISHDGTPYVVYQDAANGNKASVMKYSGGSWVTVGNPGFSAGGAAGYNNWIAIAGNGTPYVVYTADADSDKVTAMKFNGSSWVAVGDTGFSGCEAAYASIAIGTDDTPYVAYWNLSNAVVMKFNGSNWENVGSVGFSAGADYLTIAMNNTGTPYLASGEHYIEAYNESNWVALGTSGFSAADIASTSLALDPWSTPYVAFQDYSTLQQGATVAKYSGTNWEKVGSPEFSAGEALNTGIAINGSGIPYVVYTDCANGCKATVMTPGSWLKTNNLGVMASIQAFPNPNSGSFTLHISETANENANVTITNVLGEKVSEYILPTNTGNAIQLRVAPGMYFVTAVGNNTNVTTKITIE